MHDSIVLRFCIVLEHIKANFFYLVHVCVWIFLSYVQDKPYMAENLRLDI